MFSTSIFRIYMQDVAHSMQLSSRQLLLIQTNHIVCKFITILEICSSKLMCSSKYISIKRQLMRFWLTIAANTYTFGSFTNFLACLILHWNTLSNLQDSKLDIHANTSADNELDRLHIPSKVATMLLSPYKVKVRATRSTLAMHASEDPYPKWRVVAYLPVRSVC